MSIREIEPKIVWGHFDSLTQIPHPSGHEEEIQKFILDFGKSLGLETEIDEASNILIRKPATPGMESRRGVILQGHLDMVPQKNSDKVHDFTKDPIETLIEDGWVTANGTTLGADNGLGVAAAMAVLESKDIEHGPIEALFTATEESGMHGARGVRRDWIKGDILLNLDSEDEGELYVGCAGGSDLNATFEYEPVVTPEECSYLKLSITGLRGGHSGLDINQGRANANKLMFRFFSALLDETPYYIGDVDGGSLRNAIPREAFATIVSETEDVEIVSNLVKEFQDIYRAEYGSVEPNLSFTIEEGTKPASVIPGQEMLNLIAAINICPNGVIEMSRDMEGLVETSTNLASVKSSNGAIDISCLIRSSVESSKMYLVSRIEDLFNLTGAFVEVDGSYPGWKPNLKSDILETMKESYKSLYNKEAAVKAIHAGLECGILGSAYPNWDMISFGPTLENPHSPDERANIETTVKFWDFLKETLKAIPSK